MEIRCSATILTDRRIQSGILFSTPTKRAENVGTGIPCRVIMISKE